MKTSNKVLAHNMSYARRPISGRSLILIVGLICFVIGGGIGVALSLTATTTGKPGPIVVEIHTLQKFPTAALVSQ